MPPACWATVVDLSPLLPPPPVVAAATPARGKDRRRTQAPCRSLATYRHRHTRSWSDAAALGGSCGLGGEPHGQGGAIVKRQLTRHMRSAAEHEEVRLLWFPQRASISTTGGARARVCVRVSMGVKPHAQPRTRAHTCARTASTTKPRANHKRHSTDTKCCTHTHTRTALHPTSSGLPAGPATVYSAGAHDSRCLATPPSARWTPFRLTSRPPPPPHHAGGPCSGRRSTAPAAATTPATGACGPAPPARPARVREWR